MYGLIEPTADHIRLRRKRVHVPAGKLFFARRSGVLVCVLFTTIRAPAAALAALSPFRRGIHVGVGVGVKLGSRITS